MILLANVEVQIAQLAARIEKQLRALGKQRVLVGIPEDKAARSDPAMNNAYLGAIHENGSPVRNIPPRPFLHPGVQKAQPRVVKKLETACANAVKDANFDPQKALGDAGMLARNSVRGMFDNNDWPPDKPITQRIKNLKHGKPPDAAVQTLVDTRQLRKSIHYVIVDESEAKS